jgi:hypothetical protein
VIVKDLEEGGQKTPDEEWIKTLADGRKVKFSDHEILEEGAFIAAQIERNDVKCPIILTEARSPLSHEDVKSHFENGFRTALAIKVCVS